MFEYVADREKEQKRSTLIYGVVMALVALGVLISVITYG